MRRIRDALADMLAEIEAMETHLAGVPLDAFAADWLLKRAVERSIAIVSEASRRLPVEMCDLTPDVPWKEIRGIGNVLRHDYDDVADRIIFQVATEQLGAIKAAVLVIRAALDEDD